MYSYANGGYDMKKCAYCAKEISYHEMYCCDECQIGANEFFEKRDKFQKLFSVINAIFVLGIGIFIFVYSFLRPVGAIGVSSCMLILGVTYFLLPFPVDPMIERFKLKKAIFITKCIAGVLFALGVLALVLFLTGVI